MGWGWLARGGGGRGHIVQYFMYCSIYHNALLLLLCVARSQLCTDILLHVTEGEPIDCPSDNLPRRKKRATYYMVDKINLLQEVLAHQPFFAEDPMAVWVQIAQNITDIAERQGFQVNGRSVRDHFDMLLKYHRENDTEKLKRCVNIYF